MSNLLKRIATLLPAAAVALTVSCHDGSVDGVEVGDEAVVPGWTWVNPVYSIFDKLESAINKEDLVDLCGVETGGIVKVLDFVDDKALVEYAAPGDTVGTPCETGTKYLISADDFRRMSVEYFSKIKGAQELKKEIRTAKFGVAGQERYVDALEKTIKIGDVIPVDVVNWVEVMNLTPVSHGYAGSRRTVFSTMGDYDSCVTDKNGEMEVLGFTSDGRALVDYTIDRETGGTSCMDGTQFLIPSLEEVPQGLDPSNISVERDDAGNIVDFIYKGSKQ